MYLDNHIIIIIISSRRKLIRRYDQHRPIHIMERGVKRVVVDYLVEWLHSHQFLARPVGVALLKAHCVVFITGFHVPVVQNVTDTLHMSFHTCRQYTQCTHYIRYPDCIQ